MDGNGMGDVGMSGMMSGMLVAGLLGLAALADEADYLSRRALLND